MPIQTERPGGGDDRIPVYRATSPEAAKRARAALEAAGVPVDLPDQAIDVIFQQNPQAELPVMVALKHAPKALKVISDAIPREEPPSPILEAVNPNKAAEESLAVQALPEPVTSGDKIPVGAVERLARKAFLVAILGVLFPPAGFLGAIWGWSALGEINRRKAENISGGAQARLAVFAGTVIGLVGTVGFVLYMQGRH